MGEKNIIYSQRYVNMKNGGTIIDNIELRTKLFQEYIEELTSRQIQQSFEEKNLNTLFEDLCLQFEKLYGEKIENVELINRYQKGIRVSAYTSKLYPAIYVDELFESTLMSFLYVCFLWSEFENDPEIWSFCFRYMLFIFHEQCILGEMVCETDLKRILEYISKKDPHIFYQASDCYWTILTFCLSHELAHIYFDRMGRESITYKQRRQEEFDADRIAYDMVLHIIMEDAKYPENKRRLYEFTSLAPMILMEYFDLFYYTDRVLYKQWVNDNIHPTPIKRKNQLFGILYKPEYELKTNEANALFHAVLNVTDRGYKDNLLLKMHRGKLTNVLDYERRTEFLSEKKIGDRTNEY